MAIEEGTFQNLSPSRFLTFSFPNPDSDPLRLGDDSLRIAVLDSPRPSDPDPRVAALLVPNGREHDWIFSSSYGHLQLIANSQGISRLILVGNPPRADPGTATYTRPVRSDESSRARFQKMLIPLLLALCPKSAFRSGIPEIPFIVYEDNVFRSVPVEVCNGPVVGEMLVEDVEIETAGDGEEDITGREFRRRLRFKRMPNLIQTQMRIVSADGESRPDMTVFVQPYLPPMVASLSLIAPHLEECTRSGSRPRALCVGVGGGALLSFLRVQLGFFDIVGVEMDDTVFRVAKQHFGLAEDEFLRVCVGDGVELIQKFALRVIHWNSLCDKLALHPNSSFSCHLVPNGFEINRGIEMGRCVDDRDSLIDVIMVDLDSSDATNPQSAPPLEFVQKKILLAVRSALHGRGVFALNVIKSGGDSFYGSLVTALGEVFSELYEIDIGNGENYVLVATVLPVGFVDLESKSTILDKLRRIIDGSYIDRLRKI
eukprot:TRINITY_DN7980_c3_g1_i1.p1 TRINITY_DN7980_c3_g1~~TRINITY_DN7980_c3_g1_i1.p1  ORF type:complete len:485 (+),score=42.11 TRINITY_DN7980_c3_g1_i1:241-1695(+)